ncbi:MAG: thermonuclease family protein [Pirellulales bacterium]|nr:thermonuclease family protein [Pirellulales bacterium]
MKQLTAIIVVSWTAMLAGTSSVADEAVAVPKKLIRIDDGDTIEIHWGKGRVETVRILGIDAPEVRHLEHNLPYDQPFGTEARGFLRGAIAAARKVTLLRAKDKDQFGRTLGYVYVDGTNVSPLLIEARLAVEAITPYGDNGLPAQAKKCLAAAERASPVPFEHPDAYRKRMQKVSKWLKARSMYPQGTK